MFFSVYAFIKIYVDDYNQNEYVHSCHLSFFNIWYLLLLYYVFGESIPSCAPGVVLAFIFFLQIISILLTVVWQSLSFMLMHVIISPFIMNGNFAGYSNLSGYFLFISWQYFCLFVCLFVY